jgi:hypothetical protein
MATRPATGRHLRFGREMAELPGYLRIITENRVQVPLRVFPLSVISDAWAAADAGGEPVVVVPG